MSDAMTTERPISISENAAKRVKALITGEGNPDLMLRVQVSGGGCSGFQYGFGLSGDVAEDDQIVDQHGVRVVIDEASLEFLRGSEVDYVEDMIGAAFTMRNPNATSTCGCGTSFAV